MAKLLLIDGDVIAYRAAFAAEKTRYLCETHEGLCTSAQSADEAKKLCGPTGVIWSRKDVEPEDKAIFIADQMIRDILARFHDEGFKKAVLFVSGVGNFRHGIATRASYKGNRAGAVPPKHLVAVRRHLLSAWSGVLSSGEEADDLIGIWATENPGSIVCSIDKDLKQLAGRHYNFATKEESTVTAKEATLNLFAQIIAGDATDNVPGVDGFGLVKAHKALAGAAGTAECFEKAFAIYQKEYGAAATVFFLETARLVYVRRQKADDFVRYATRLLDRLGIELPDVPGAVALAAGSAA